MSDAQTTAIDAGRTIECHSPCSGKGVWLEKYHVFACPFCGDIGREENIETTTTGTPLLSGGDESDFIRIVGRVVADEQHVGPMALVKAPYGAKNDIKKLPYRKSERQWSEEYGHWVIIDSWRDRFVEHMSSHGWDVVDFLEIRRNMEVSDA